MIQYNDNTNTQLGNAYILAYGAQEFRLSLAEAAQVAVTWLCYLAKRFEVVAPAAARTKGEKRIRVVGVF